MRAGDPAPDQEYSGRMDLGQYLEQLVTAPSEDVYTWLTGYGFARRYVRGKTVANIRWEEVGFGSELLAETAESVAGLTNSAEAVGLASTIQSAPNVSYRKVSLPELPYPEEYFDVVVAFGVIENLEQPEHLVREAKRILKQDGVLVVSVPDKQVWADYRDRGNARYSGGMYALELWELLEQNFERVHTYRQGAAAGAFVFPASGKLAGALMESAPSSLIAPRFGVEPPTSRSILAVCGNTEILEREEQPYVLLDLDRRIFDECAELAEDVELLREEIVRLQETEVQAFQDALMLHASEITYLRARIRRSEAQVESLKNHIRNMENSKVWRLFKPYRLLRARIDAIRKPAPGRTKGSSDHPSS